MWMPSVWLLWSCTEFAALQILFDWGLEVSVGFWFQRIFWAVFALAAFWLAWEIARRYLLIKIERHDVQER